MNCLVGKVESDSEVELSTGAPAGILADNTSTPPVKIVSHGSPRSASQIPAGYVRCILFSELRLLLYSNLGMHPECLFPQRSIPSHFRDTTHKSTQQIQRVT